MKVEIQPVDSVLMLRNRHEDRSETETGDNLSSCLTLLAGGRQNRVGS